LAVPKIANVSCVSLEIKGSKYLTDLPRQKKYLFTNLYIGADTRLLSLVKLALQTT
jgi:hypothetical protein